MKRVMIATGGTGGHIYPALALADTIRKNCPECEIRFFGSDNRMEAQVIPAAGYAFAGMTMSGMNGGILAKVKSLISLQKAERSCQKMLKEFQPEVCIGFGNYISVPLIRAAHKLGIPTMISEQNSSAGKANLYLSRIADAIEAVYPSSLKEFPEGKTRLYGNPEASAAAAAPGKPELLKEYGLEPGIPMVVCMMGSLGSSSVSEVLDQACAKFDDSFQVLIAAGKSNDYTFRSQGKRIHILPYIDGRAMLKEADLAITRAGATTLAEISAIGTAAILIPSPYVPNNHQVHNAEELVRHHAAVMIEEKDLNADVLASTVNRLMKNQEERQNLAANAKSMGTPDAAEKMYEWVKELADHGNNA